MLTINDAMCEYYNKPVALGGCGVATPVQCPKWKPIDGSRGHGCVDSSAASCATWSSAGECGSRVKAGGGRLELSLRRWRGADWLISPASSRLSLLGSPPLVTRDLSRCASSGRAWWLGVLVHFYERRSDLWAPHRGLGCSMPAAFIATVLAVFCPCRCGQTGNAGCVQSGSSTARRH